MTTSTRSRMAAFLLMLVLALVASACSSDDDGSDDAAGDAGESADGTTDEGAETPEIVEDGVTGFVVRDEAERADPNPVFAAFMEMEVSRTFSRPGAREVVLPALTSGEIDVYPEYVGTALEFLNEGAGEATGDTEASTELLRERFAEQGVDVLEPSDAQDKNGLVVRQETADTYGLSTVSDLADVVGDLTLGGPPECPERPLCIPGYESAYGVTFGDFRSLDAGGPVTIEALSAGEIDVALLFTTDGVIAANDWVLLDDDQDLQPAENIVPVIRSEANTDAATEALDAVSAVLTTENVTEMIRQLRVDLADPAEVAETFLTDQGVLG